LKVFFAITAGWVGWEKKSFIVAFELI